MEGRPPGPRGRRSLQPPGAWRGQGAPPECPHPDWCRALAPPPPHGSALRHPPDGPRSPRPSRGGGGLMEARDWGKEATERAGPAPEGEGGERTTGGPQPSCAHPPPSLTLLGIWEQRLRNAVQRERDEERGNLAPHPNRCCDPYSSQEGQAAPRRPPSPAPSQPGSPSTAGEPRPLARLRPRAAEPRLTA